VATPSPYDYFTRLAGAILDGRLYLTEGPKWLNELIPIPQGRFYVPFSPMPTLVSIPFLLLSRVITQSTIAAFTGALTAVTTTTLALKITGSPKKGLYVWLTVGFGSLYWFLGSVGSSWYFGQLTSGLFLTLALLEANTKKRPIVAGILLGGSYLARPHTLLAFPVILYLLVLHHAPKPKLRLSKNQFRPIVLFALGISVFLLTNFAYNFVRFGVIWDKGYVLIPNVLSEPWFQEGIFSLSYIPRHINTMFASLPVKIEGFPYFVPSWHGLSVWFTTPVLVYAFLGKLDGLARVTWLSIVLAGLPIITHGTTGVAQFGYRYLVDLYPLFFFLIIRYLKSTKLAWHHYFLLLWSVGVSVWGLLTLPLFA